MNKIPGISQIARFELKNFFNATQTSKGVDAILKVVHPLFESLQFLKGVDLKKASENIKILKTGANFFQIFPILEEYYEKGVPYSLETVSRTFLLIGKAMQVYEMGTDWFSEKQKQSSNDDTNRSSFPNLLKKHWYQIVGSMLITGFSIQLGYKICNAKQMDAKLWLNTIHTAGKIGIVMVYNFLDDKTIPVTEKISQQVVNVRWRKGFDPKVHESNSGWSLNALFRVFSLSVGLLGYYKETHK